jgi:hypothetical protein
MVTGTGQISVMAMAIDLETPITLYVGGFGRGVFVIHQTDTGN